MTRRCLLRILTGAACLAAVVLLGVPALAGGGSTCRGFGEGSRISLLDNCFDATAHVLATGDTVEIANDGSQPHSYTAVDGAFDTGVIKPYGRAEVSVPAPGTYPVYCTLHSSPEGEGMSGLLVVGRTGTGAPPADPEGGAPLVPTAAAAVGVGALVGAAAGHRGVRRWAAARGRGPLV